MTYSKYILSAIEVLKKNEESFLNCKKCLPTLKESDLQLKNQIKIDQLHI
jgi:hypothetical protein